ncbi:MAG: hypothetical protein M3R47_02475 [Chloroflexota bacterium]|nr:hypothetical protein [Chloroflexota bacterium]
MTATPRTVQNNLLRSDEVPVARLQIDPLFRYVGNTSFILYDIAHVEQHHFVVADSKNRVERLLWFQFEGYLDNNQRKYNYSRMETIVLKALTFLHDTDVSNVDNDYNERPTSDFAHVVDYLMVKGYAFEGDAMFKRLVWLDADLRNELMIIYSENLVLTGHKIGDLSKGGRSAAEWPTLSRSLHERALASFTIQ